MAGYGQRTDKRMHAVLADHLGYRTVALRTSGPQWYDLDLAVAVIDNPHTIAYCPDALDRPSRYALHDLGLDLIEVSVDEAACLALNLVSDGAAVTMTSGAPRLAAQLRERGLRVTELDTTELRKGGGGVRCTALTLDNRDTHPDTTKPTVLRDRACAAAPRPHWRSARGARGCQLNGVTRCRSVTFCLGSVVPGRLARMR